ncbi:nucleotide exchange factor GrpE [Patescibacteria group bacterium]
MLDDIKIEEENTNFEDKIKKLRDKLKRCQKEKEEYLDGWQRSKADFINARKEEDKQREKFTKFANELLISELLVVLDSLDLASQNTDDKGFAMIQSQMQNILNREGLEIIETIGKKFDSEFHEALKEVVSKKQKSGTIIKEIQKGYKLNNKVLRPAKVQIVK